MGESVLTAPDESAQAALAESEFSDGDREGSDIPAPPWRLFGPAQQTAPVIFASPHSGRDYPAEFVALSRLDVVELRRSEDAYMDEIFAADCRSPRRWLSKGSPCCCSSVRCPGQDSRWP